MINKVMVILFVAVVVVLSGCSGSKPCHLPVLPYDSGLIGSFKQGEARHWGIFDFGTGSDCVWLVSYDGSSTNCFSLAGEALDVDEWLVKSPPLERLSWRLKEGRQSKGDSLFHGESSIGPNGIVVSSDGHFVAVKFDSTIHVYDLQKGIADIECGGR